MAKFKFLKIRGSQNWIDFCEKAAADINADETISADADKLIAEFVTKIRLIIDDTDNCKNAGELIEIAIKQMYPRYCYKTDLTCDGKLYQCCIDKLNLTLKMQEIIK